MFADKCVPWEVGDNVNKAFFLSSQIMIIDRLQNKLTAYRIGDLNVTV